MGSNERPSPAVQESVRTPKFISHLIDQRGILVFFAGRFLLVLREKGKQPFRFDKVQ